jgi:hypothetical protein
VELLGEDLVLLSIDRKGFLATEGSKLNAALRGSELIRLAVSHRVVIADGRIELTDRTPTGDRHLDAAIRSLSDSGRSPKLKAWVLRANRKLADGYLAGLVDVGVIRKERTKLLSRLRGFTSRYLVIEQDRAAAAKARLDEAVASAGPASVEQAAIGTLIYAVGLGDSLYPGSVNRPARKRLREIAGDKDSSSGEAEVIHTVGKVVSSASSSAASSAPAVY